MERKIFEEHPSGTVSTRIIPPGSSVVFLTVEIGTWSLERRRALDSNNQSQLSPIEHARFEVYLCLTSPIPEAQSCWKEIKLKDAWGMRVPEESEAFMNLIPPLQL